MTARRKPTPIRGRPTKGQELNATETTSVKWSPVDRDRAKALAAEHGLTVSEWIRRRATTTGAVR